LNFFFTILAFLESFEDDEELEELDPDLDEEELGLALRWRLLLKN